MHPSSTSDSKDTNNNSNEKKSRNPIIFFLIAAFLIPFIISIWAVSLYNKTFHPSWLLTERIADFFLNENTVIFYLLFFLLVTFFPFLFPRLCYITEQFPAFVKKILFSFLFLILLCLFNLFRKDFYTIDGNNVNSLKAIWLLAADCIEQETETIEVDDFDIDTHTVYYSGGRSSTGNKIRSQYVTLPDGHNIPLPSSLWNELTYLSWIKKSTTFTVYKNSKLLVAVDDIPLCDLVNNVNRPTSRFEVSLTPDGKISVIQSVILKSQPDIADHCQVCLVENGKIRAGLGIDTVNKGNRTARIFSDGVYELYVMYGTDIVSNIITYEVDGDVLRIIE